jgi:hypothetical protein
MSKPHLFILIFFGTLLILNCLRYRATMRRFDREDAEIRRLTEAIRRNREP